MTGILAVGRHAGPFLDAPTHVAHVGGDVVGDLAALRAVLADLVALHGQVLVIHPTGVAGAPRALATVRSALGGAPVLSHATDLPPLAADVLVTLAAALCHPLGGPAVVAAALPTLERQLLQLTWVPSVARLADPAPSVWQHARSAMPGSSWLVTSWPEPAIRLLDPADPPPLPRISAGQQVGIALADLDGDTSWISGMVTRAMPQAVGVQVEVPHDSAAFWGSRRSTQVVLYPRALGALADALRTSLDVGPCRWCHRLVGATTCPWCRLPRNGTTAAVDDGRDPLAGEGVFAGPARGAAVDGADGAGEVVAR